MTDIERSSRKQLAEELSRADDHRRRGLHLRGLRPRRARQAVAQGVAAGRPGRGDPRGRQLPHLRHPRRLDHRRAHRARNDRFRGPPQRVHAPRPPAGRHPRRRQERVRPGAQVVRLRIPRLDIRPGRRVHPHPRAGRLEGRADAGEHPPRSGPGRHLGRLAVHQHGSRLRTAGRLSVPRGEDPRPVRSGEHALQVAQVAVLRLQLESRDGGLQRDLPRVHHASGVQQVRRVQGLGQGAGQAQQHRLRRAEGHGRDQVQDPARHRRSAHLDGGDAGLHHGRDQRHHHPDAGQRRQAAGRRTARGHPGRQGARALAGLGAPRRRGARRGLADDPGRHPRPERHRVADLPELPGRPGPDQRAVLQRPARSELRPEQVHLRGRGVRALPERPRAADRMAVHPGGRSRTGCRCCRRTSRTWPRCSRA